MEGGECKRLMTGSRSVGFSHRTLPQHGQVGALWGLDEFFPGEARDGRAARIRASDFRFFEWDRKP